MKRPRSLPHRLPPALAAFVTLAAGACVTLPERPPPPVVEAKSLLGEDLMRPELSPVTLETLEAQLAEAREAWRLEQTEEAAIWVGRRLAYLGRMHDSVDWFSARLVDFPESYRLRRHRGHRWITLRRFPDAIDDLQEAWELCADLPDEVEPDGIPNASGVPTSTDHTNVLYHLGLARYFSGSFADAAATFRMCLERCPNDEMRVATANWLVASLRRDGRDDEARNVLAAIPTEDVELRENEDYLAVLRLEKGFVLPEDLHGAASSPAGGATIAYGVAVWSWCEGRREEAVLEWKKIVAATPWNAFGHIGAEADLARLAETTAGGSPP